MPKYILKKLYKFLFIFVMFFSYLKGVSAANWYYKSITNLEDPNVNLFSKCNADNGCVPLCIYSTYDESLSGNKYGDEVALIGYFYDGDHKWQIAYFNENSSTSSSARLRTLYYSDDTFIPKTNIYWKDIEMNWNNSAGYERLDNSFSCPGILYTDSGTIKSGNELCFGDAINDYSCEKIGGGLSVDFDSDDKLLLTYSFANDNFRNVMNEVITKLEVHDTDIPNYQLLASVDSDFNYNSNLTEENCKYFKENFEKVDSYSSKLVTEENVKKYIDSNINHEIKYEAQIFEVRFPHAYTFDNLSKMLDTDENGNFRNIGGNEKNFSNVNKLFYDRLVDIMDKGARACNDNYGTNINFQRDQMYDSMKTKYEDILKPDISIDFDSEYDCGILNGISDIISTGYFIIEILSIVILIAFSVLDYAKIILNGDADQMKKSNGNLFKRIIIVAIIFLLPAILNFTLRLFKIEGFNSENPLCIEIKK